MSYIGRFAPSPSGPLHTGSLITALASWLDARRHNGRWLLRIEDIDPPREIDGASEQIIDSLQRHGLTWDGMVAFQSKRSHHYEDALQYLRDKGLLYACSCTRRQLRRIADETTTHAYPGVCRKLQLPEENSALRFRIGCGLVTFCDEAAGTMSENVPATVGDFIVRRRGPFYAYQLAVVVDDALQGISHVVRGSDLLDNTARQILLQRALEYPALRYLHLPLVLQTDGRKLSKQTGAAALDNNNALKNLLFAWSFLGQQATEDQPGSITEFLEFAVANWQRERLPALQKPGSNRL
ncbi:tRNA glutamyl-Q(34) synthetase GluQRS [Chromatiales bacterium (ex Bugula neritina AB1)]|nr:tRNA glutamyl-Q(34) synthetase GluQRS [Chromatiales bacterium (ex Bugula neritina AB1)]